MRKTLAENNHFIVVLNTIFKILELKKIKSKNYQRFKKLGLGQYVEHFMNAGQLKAGVLFCYEYRFIYFLK